MTIRGRKPLLAMLSIMTAAAVGCAGAGDHADKYGVYAPPHEGTPTLAIGETDLGLIKNERVLVAYSRSRELLAHQVAEVLREINDHLARMVGPAIRIHGLVLISRSDELPLSEPSKWVNLDGAAALVIRTDEEELPFSSDFTNYMVFMLLAHENVDIGIKYHCLAGGVFSSNRSSRWYVEGIAEFAAYRTISMSQPNALTQLRTFYLASLSQQPDGVIDIESPATWFPPDYLDPMDVVHAYAASHFAVWSISEAHGTDWIAETLIRLAAEDIDPRATSGDFLRIASLVTGDDLRKYVNRIEIAEVREFAESLGGPVGRQP